MPSALPVRWTMALRTTKQRVWFGIGLTLLVVLAFTLRTTWNADVAQVGDEYLLAESDAYYHKHAADIIQESWQHPRNDPLVNYPVGGANPNPPLFEWTLAVGGVLLQPFFGGDLDASTWWWTAHAPAVFGALTLIPAALVGLVVAGPWAGILGAFFLATSPTHIDRTNLGFSDHDGAVLFFALWFVYGMVMAVRRFTTEGTGLTGYRNWLQRGHGVGYAVLAGSALAAVALIWKGFPYLIGALVIYMGFALVVASWRRKDPIPEWAPALTAMAVPLLIAAPYYAAPELFHFFRPALFLFAGSVVAAAVFHYMRSYPPVATVPALAAVAGVLILVAFFVFPDIARATLYNFVYFKQTKLYTTIAEANPAQFQDFAFAIGPFAFFMYVVGFAMLVWWGLSRKDAGVWFLVTLTALEFYMATSAVRFVFNLTGTMAIVAGIMSARFAALLQLPRLQTLGRNGWSLRAVRQSVGILQVIAVPLLALTLILPNLWMGVDAATPFAYENQRLSGATEELERVIRDAGNESNVSDERVNEVVALAFQQTSHGAFRGVLIDYAAGHEDVPDAFVQDVLRGSREPYGTIAQFRKRLSAFGESFISQGWLETLEFLRDRDPEPNAADRPGFLSWWDYGHWAISISDHPAVADNFQNGYVFAAHFLTTGNETKALQLLAARIARWDDPATPERDGNASVRRALEELGVAQARSITDSWVKEEFILAPLDREGSVSLVERVQELTGKRIWYFATDSRMMPFDDPDTPNVEEGSIFYAPVTLSDQEGDDFIPQMLIDTRTGVRLSIDQYVELARQPGFDQANYRQVLIYRGAFHESMFYRGFWGTPIRAPLQFGQQTFPNPVLPEEYPIVYSQPMLIGADDIDGATLLRTPPLPGLGLAHWRLIAANQEVRLLEYYPGARLNGTVTFDGQPLAGVRVIVLDDAGPLVFKTAQRTWEQIGMGPEDLNIAHASVLTDADGAFALPAPFGNVTVVVIPGDSTQAFEMASATVAVTRQEAHERAELPPLTLTVEPVVIEGTVFHDMDADGQFGEGDEAVPGAEVVAGEVVTTADAEGRYQVEIVPGQVRVTASADSLEGPGQTVQARPGETTTLDLPLRSRAATVDVTVLDDEGAPVEGLQLELTRDTSARPVGDNATAFSNPNGTLSLQVRPGTYDATGSVSKANATFEVDRLEVVSGDAVADGARLTIQDRATAVEVRVHLRRA